MTPRRLRSTDTPDLQSTLGLIQREFSSMAGVIDPPSSVHRLTIDDLASGQGETWVIGKPPVASVVMAPKPDVLYVSKLEVEETERGNGLARLLLGRKNVAPWAPIQPGWFGSSVISR